MNLLIASVGRTNTKSYSSSNHHLFHVSVVQHVEVAAQRRGADHFPQIDDRSRRRCRRARRRIADQPAGILIACVVAGVLVGNRSGPATARRSCCPAGRPAEPVRAGFRRPESRARRATSQTASPRRPRTRPAAPAARSSPAAIRGHDRSDDDRAACRRTSCTTGGTCRTTSSARAEQRHDEQTATTTVRRSFCAKAERLLDDHVLRVETR